jgi:hypothetical protein
LDTNAVKENQAKRQWIEEVGIYKYYALILTGFNPVLADQVFDQPADVIAAAFVSKQAYEYIDKQR